MRRSLGLMIGVVAVLGLTAGARAQEAATYPQDAASYPPASGHMSFVYPSYPSPYAFGGQYVETYPAAGVAGTNVAGATTTQPATGRAATANPTQPSRLVAPAARVRGRLFRGRTYSRGYNAAPAPAPYATPLPQGQLYWPGSYVAPGYTPYNRSEAYETGYGRGPYGSGFYGGMYQGRPLGN